MIDPTKGSLLHCSCVFNTGKKRLVSYTNRTKLSETKCSDTEKFWSTTKKRITADSLFLEFKYPARMEIIARFKNISQEKKCQHFNYLNAGKIRVLTKRINPNLINLELELNCCNLMQVGYISAAENSNNKIKSSAREKL